MSKVYKWNIPFNYDNAMKRLTDTKPNFHFKMIENRIDFWYGKELFGISLKVRYLKCSIEPIDNNKSIATAKFTYSNLLKIFCLPILALILYALFVNVGNVDSVAYYIYELIILLLAFGTMFGSFLLLTSLYNGSRLFMLNFLNSVFLTTYKVIIKE